jgi:hypothetical protein
MLFVPYIIRFGLIFERFVAQGMPLPPMGLVLVATIWQSAPFYNRTCFAAIFTANSINSLANGLNLQTIGAATRD